MNIFKKATWAWMLILLALVLIASQMFNANVLSRLFINPHSSYFDTGHYFNLAHNPKCWAFYPLWPKIISFYSSISRKPLPLASSMLSQISFLTVAVISFAWFNKRQVSAHQSHLAWGLYLLSPMTLFLLNGYSESLFAVLSWILVCLMSVTIKFDRQDGATLLHCRNIFGITILLLAFIVSFLLNYSRPVVLQTVASVTVALSVRSSEKKEKVDLHKCFDFIDLFYIIILLGALAGYSVYGLECLNSGKSFIEPFLSQSTDWDKSFGFRPIFLINSKSPMIDLWGLYYPTALLVFGFTNKFSRFSSSFNLLHASDAWFLPVFLVYPPLAITLSLLKSLLNQIRIQNDLDIPNPSPLSFEQHPRIAINPNSIFFYCCTFSASHSAIVFFTQENYMYSLGRYIFGQPYFYVALSMVLPLLSKSYKGRFVYVTVLSIVLSSALLAVQFNNYANAQWSG